MCLLGAAIPSTRMASKNCAVMKPHTKPLLALLLCAALLPHGAQAEKADRLKDLTIEAQTSSVLDLIRRHYRVTGDVVITQGTLVMKAHQAEVSETPEGFRLATLTGTPGQKASFRQKREGVDEYIEGSAERIEYDSRLQTVRFHGDALVRRMRGGVVADEASGALISYDNLAEVFSATPAAGSDSRIRFIISPREGSAASAPGGAKPVSRP